jgi:hypothetical protein
MMLALIADRQIHPIKQQRTSTACFILPDNFALQDFVFPTLQ